jgi:hypothetical protein
MRKIFLLMAVVSVVVTRTFAQHNDWTLSLSNGEKISEVSFLSLNRDTLFINSSGVEEWIPFSSVEKIQRRESSPKTAIGLVVGGAVGVGLGYLAGSTLTGTNTYGSIKASDSKGLYELLGGLLGAGIGAGMGGSSGVLKYDLHSMMIDEKAALMKTIFTQEKKPFFFQPESPDVVYLTNGDSVRGYVIDPQSDSMMTVQSINGSSPAIKRSDVVRISKGQVIPRAPQSLEIASERHRLESPVTKNSQKPLLTVNAGFSVPTGPTNFSTYWKPGFNLGFGVGSIVLPSTSMFIRLDYNNFPLDAEGYLRANGAAGSGYTIDGGTVSIITITGNVKVAVGPTTSVVPYFIGGGGFFNLSQSDITISNSGSYLKVSIKSEIALTLAGGFGVEIPVDQSTNIFAQISYGVGFNRGDHASYMPVKVGAVFGL